MPEAPPVAAAVTIATADLAAWVVRLGLEGTVIAPTAVPGGDVLFAPIESPDDVLWECDNPLAPPKAFVLPQTDPLVRIRRGEGGVQVSAFADERPRILLNVRSCDVTGLAYLAGVYARDLPDGAVARRMAATAQVSLACTEPCADGFCVCCDAGPFLAGRADLQLVPLGERMLAEVLSDRGRALVEAGGGLFRAAEPAEVDRRRELERSARSRLGERTCHFGSAMRRVSTGRVAPALWEHLSDWCLGCGACTMICPSCYCFAVRDLPDDGGWLRCRLWDSCQYPAFTLEASGHNPRQHRADRIRRRFFHKVSAQYYQRDGAVGCVGCGRCVKVCLGAGDMPAVVTAVREGGGARHG